MSARRLGLAVLLTALLAAPAQAGPLLPGGLIEPMPSALDLGSSTPLLGSGRLGLDLDVGRYRLLDPGATISFDVRLGWPLPAEVEAPAALQPYVVVGPTLFLADAEAAPPVGPGGDASAVLGIKAGAGVAWYLDQRASLFGEYRVTRGAFDALTPAGRIGRSDVTGFDLLYGLRLRF